MGSTHSALHIHIVFGTKDRIPALKHEWQPRIHAYLGATLGGLGAVSLGVGGVADHVHMLASLKTTHNVADVVRETKKASCAWIRGEFRTPFAWQEGYGAFSVSPSHTARVIRYIADQERHHRRIGFAEELRRILEGIGVPFDPAHLL